MCNIVFETHLVCITTCVGNSTNESCVNYTSCKVICDLNIFTCIIRFEVSANRNSSRFINKLITCFDSCSIYNMSNYVIIKCDIFGRHDAYTNGSESPDCVILNQNILTRFYDKSPSIALM